MTRILQLVILGLDPGAQGREGPALEPLGCRIALCASENDGKRWAA
jgi:hypothetical protein